MEKLKNKNHSYTYIHILKKILVYIMLISGALVMVFPFYWMFVSAFKTPAEIASMPPIWFPSSFNLDNFVYSFSTAPFHIYFLNSCIVLICVVVISTFTTILAAFAFSRLNFPGQRILLSLLLTLMMVPFEMLVITNYTTVNKLGLIDRIGALIIPFTASVFYMYILRNFFASIPDELYKAARIDGASNWQYLFKIMVPMAKPSITTIILLNAISCWNSFFWPLLAINSSQHRTLTLGLYTFMTEGGIYYEKLMAASLVVVMPMIILFIIARKHIINGVANGGLKG